MLTKRTLFDSATAYAQGIAAALGAGDSLNCTGRIRWPPARRCVTGRPCRCWWKRDRPAYGSSRRPAARFDLDPDGDFKLGKEAAHSRHRIVHANGDQTGAEVARTLVAKVRESPNIDVRETARVLDLLLVQDEDGVQCAGVRASIAGRPVEIVADATALATGGRGPIFRYTTNPQVATGDGFAIAHRAGARLADMEFVQFHPTALDTPENPLALISEAVRGGRFC